MKISKSKFTRLLSVITAIILLFSCGWPGLGQVKAQSDSDASTSLHKSQPQSKTKISKDLKGKFKKKDQLTFLVKFKEQVDTKKVADEAVNKAKKNSLSMAKTELKKRTAVVSALRAKSLDTQATVKQFLQKQKKAGNIKSFDSFYIVNTMAVTGTKEVAEELAKFGEIEKILPNRTRHLIEGNHTKTKEKALAQSKVETSDDNTVEPNIEHIGAPQVWKMGIDGTGTVVASIDTGVQWDHPALKEKYRGYDPDNSDQPNNEFNWFDATGGDQDAPYDDNSHGTHSTGTIVGSEADGSNQIGVAPGAKWIAAKAFGAKGTGLDTDILAAGEWMLAPKDANGNPHPEKAPDIVNNSWGGGAGLDELYRPMVKSWRAAGIFPVFAAGNVDLDNPGGPGSVASPGNFPESFAVGATNNNDELASFSLQGPSPYDEIKPEVVAPGVGIRSSIPGADYGGKNGTSMAAPAVSGTVALLLQANASLKVDEVEDILLNTAKPLTDNDFPNSPNNGYGHGLIQAFHAVSSVVSGLGTVEGTVSQEGEDNEPPTYQHEAPDQSYAGIDIPLEMSAQDNVVVKGVKLQYRSSKNDEWQTTKAELVDGNYKDGVYDAIIPGDSVGEPSVEYRWTIADYGGNDVTTDIYKVDVKPGITTGYSTDFETPPVGWTSYGISNYWEWGKPTSGPGKAFSGDNVYATNLDGGTSNMSTATLEMPPIDLPGGESYLRFKQWYSFYMAGDVAVSRGYILISTDQENWTRLGEFGGDGESDGWVDGEFSLSKYAGQRVYIAFQYASLGNMDKPGWYLDDVKLSDTPLHQDEEPPTYDQQTPSKAYAGMKLPLTIDVQDNYSVEQVELQYRGADSSDWQSVQAELVEGDKSDGTYSVTIPGEDVNEPSITYRWHLVDYGGNEVTSDTYEVPVGTPVTIGYSTDFESDPGWISYGNNNSWERGTPTSGPEHAISGDNVYATNLDGDYPDGSDAYLEMPPLELPDGNAYLQFKHWYKFTDYDYTRDFGEVLVSTDQENWEPLARFNTYGSIWQYVEADLSDYAGKTVYVAFHIESDETGGHEPGWYLDDVTLSDTSIFRSNQAHLGVMPHHQNSQALKKIKAEKTLEKAKSSKKTLKKSKKLNKKSVDLDNMKPAKRENVKTPFASHKASKNNKTREHVSSLPLNATVSVQETGIFTKTDPRDGSYSMIHPEGTYTLEADAYGFRSQTQSVEIPKDGKADAKFTLQPIPKGTITGKVTNKSTGEPVANATVMLMEDPAIAPVKTDENGNYSFTAYEGNYTLHVSALKYHSKDVDVMIKGDESTEKDVQLKPFIGTPGEIGYDDGTPENARAFNEAGNGWAVKMSLPEGQDSAMVTGGKFLFWNDLFPSPGGDKFKVEIWDAGGKDGAPGKKLAGPVDATAIRDETQWTKVDLSELGVIVDGDFYMVYIQTKDGDQSPGLATDENSPNAGRSWQMGGGSWSPSPADQGNYMIRALVSYELTPPVITSPKGNSFTNDSTITVKGEAKKGATVDIMNNGDKVVTTDTTDDGKFSADITLKDGENVLTATASTDAGTTEPSDTVTVTLDQDKPRITIDSPKDRSKTNKMVANVNGTVSDKHLDWVKVNGKKANIDEDGSYSQRVLLDNGENNIKVVAQDKAGNKTTKTVTVFAKSDAPEISNLKPAEDQYLNTGQSVIISMDTEPGLHPTFMIHLPLANPSSAKTSSIKELPMMETTPGHYIGVWTATSMKNVKGAGIEVIVKDDYGNVSRKEADGELFINVPKSD
ncbi:S8 family serine peptidase [Virgibacillus dakarensis]|nr:S8 family serine peptidase [Virgibacillus dakarensis]